MLFRRAVFIIGLGTLLLSGSITRPLFAAPADEPVARVHWLGLNTISTDTNAAAFLKVWHLSQTTALVAQTLDKLSRWPGHGVTNAASARLRPLLDDLINSEFYLEVYPPTNPQSTNGQVSGFRSKVSGFSLALRLPPDRARLWQTNLPTALPSVKISQSGDWTLVSLGSDTNLSPSASAFLVAHRPAPTACTNWFTADFAPAALSAFRFPLSAFFSQLSGLKFQVSGASGELLTHATLDFSQPLPVTLPPWEIPTNLIHAPLTSFTALRGFGPWLATLPVWKNLQFSYTPDQAFFWAQTGVPFQTYFATPLPGASNQLSQLAVGLVQKANPWLATNGEGNFVWRANPPEILWNGALLFAPFLKPVNFHQQDYVLGGLAAFPEDNSNPMPDQLLHRILGIPNLAYYHFEHTGDRVEEGLFILQLFRVVFHKSQLPMSSVSSAWLKKIELLLGDSRTLVTQTGPEQLTMTRTSTVGLTAIELHLLSDWLESPQFPRGLHTFLAPPDKL